MSAIEQSQSTYVRLHANVHGLAQKAHRRQAIDFANAAEKQQTSVAAVLNTLASGGKVDNSHIKNLRDYQLTGEVIEDMKGFGLTEVELEDFKLILELVKADYAKLESYLDGDNLGGVVNLASDLREAKKEIGELRNELEIKDYREALMMAAAAKGPDALLLLVDILKQVP